MPLAHESRYLSARCTHISPSGTRRIMDAVQSVEGAIRLDIGEPDFPTPGPIVSAGQQALADGYTKYTPGGGIRPLRNALVARYQREYGLEVDPESQVLVTSGGASAVSLALLALIGPGDEALIPDPGWATYDGMVRLAGGVPIGYPLDPDRGLKPDPETLRKLVSNRTKLILVNSPGNPSGSVLDASDLATIAAIADEHDLLMVSDEVYEKIIFDNRTHVCLATVAPERTVVIGSASKTWSMTGWRIGYAIGPAFIIRQMSKLQPYVTGSPNAAAQAAVHHALTHPDDAPQRMRDEYQRRRDFFVAELRTLPGVECSEPGGSFYVFPRFNWAEDDEQLCVQLIKSARVTSIPGSAFGSRGRGHLRFSLVQPVEMLSEAVNRLRQARPILATA